MCGTHAIELRRFVQGAGLTLLAVIALTAALPAQALALPTSESDDATAEWQALLTVDPTFVDSHDPHALPSDLHAGTAESLPSSDDVVTTSIAVPEPSTVATVLLASMGGAIYWCRRRFDAMCEQA
ncbi:PEP-CTERM sorting domain-containing protein [Aeoliella sp.]|uniref:PEP-CTERM sorting domain-containing protein n=1 Tax=Aeoliella sp. TaxID=2795800 RepID=UPI003CCB8449